MKIPYRKQPALEFFNPYKLLYILAFWAVSIPATIVTCPGIATGITGEGMATHFGSPAGNNISVGLVLIST
jgi:hypothetical protein